MKGKLTVQNGDLQGKVFSLAETRVITVGRISSNTIHINNSKVSRVHCRLQNDGEQCVAYDMNSRNGTYVNGKRIKVRALREKDIIRIGPVELIFGFDTSGAIKRIKSDPNIFASEHVCAECSRKITGLQFERGKTARRNGRLVCEECGDGDDLVGRCIAGYDIREKLSENDFFAIYRASQLSMARDVALKVLSSDLSKVAPMVDYFLSGTKMAGKLRHPNIIQVYDAGQPEGITYLSLEYASGRSAKEIITEAVRGAVPPLNASIRIVRQTLNVLQYVSDNGVECSDITPLEIIVCDDGVVKIADRGISLSMLHQIDDANVPEVPVELLCFFPPEVLFGEPYDFRAAVYTAGTVLYAMFTGRIPFLASTPQETIKQITAVSAPSAKDYNLDVTASLSGVLERALKKDPEHRFATPAEMANALEMA